MENPLAKLVPQFFGDYPKQFLELYNQVYVPSELNKDEIRDNLWRAFEFGSRYHEGQKRKSGEPYFNHCVEVAITSVSYTHLTLPTILLV